MPKASQDFSPARRCNPSAVSVLLVLLALGMNSTGVKSSSLTTTAGRETGTVPRTLSPQTTPEWQPQASGTSAVLLGVSFTDSNKGYAVGTNGVIRITANGGSSWSAQASGTSRFLRDVYFSDATHGIIVGESGLILRTIDGTTWSLQTSGTIEHLVHVHFVNNSVGMASGQGGVILKTADGGVTWTPQNSGTGVELPGVHMLDVNTAIAVGFGGVIRRTTNGGNSWGSVSVPGFTSDLRSVDFFGNTGVAVSIGGGILRSTDGGQSWTSISSPTSNDLYAVKFKNSNTVYAVGSGKVLVSSDGGSSWASATTTPFSSDLYSVAFNSGNGWAVGQNGLILHAESNNTPNQIDQAEFFVRQHYLDFFSREPDASGLMFWTNEITSCGNNQSCTEVKRNNVSAAFFLSIEFQETGYLVYRLYKAAYGNIPGGPVPVRFTELLPDTQQIGVGVVVGQTGWEQQLESNKQSFVLAFVNRSRFSSAFPNSLTPAQFVDALFVNSGITPSTGDRAAAISEFGSAGDTADTAARSRALRRVAENSILRQQEYNRAFVLMQYFGYLRRNPYDPPETTLDFQGYNFWLSKLNQFNGNFIEAEMVKAFITSVEYRQRFGPP